MSGILLLVIGLLAGDYIGEIEGANSNQQVFEDNFKHALVAGSKGKFAGWPANNGRNLWTWDDGNEILIGYTWGDYLVQKGHNLCSISKKKNEKAMGKSEISLLARSTNGGQSWIMERPNGFVGQGGELKDLKNKINFLDPGFVFRVVGAGYHGANQEKGEFFYSYDRGKSWMGPYRFVGLMKYKELRGLELTSRTDYVVNSSDEILVLGSVRIPGNGPRPWKRDRVFVSRSQDGGRSFHFIAWVVSPNDPHRAVMPSTVKISDKKLVSVIRRRDLKTNHCWVDAYLTEDVGQSWSFLSFVGDTGLHNGNPASLTQLRNGNLVAAYGNRNALHMIVRVSKNEGKTWEQEIVFRDSFYPDYHGDPDFGYSRIFENQQGRVVLIYYWATKIQPQQHISATIWNTDAVLP